MAEDLYGSDKPRDVLRRYQAQVRAAMKDRRDKYDDDWRSFINLYANRHFIDIDWAGFEGVNKISVGVSFATINTIFPAVSVNNPKITVTANHPDLTNVAETVEAVVNHWWVHFDFQDEFRAAVKDYLILGHGWIKCTYLYSEEDKQRPPDEMQGEFEDKLNEKYQAIEARPQDAALFPSDEEIFDLIPTVAKVVMEDHPQIERVSPFDMFVDPDASRLYDAKWLAQRIAVPYDVAKDNKDWKAKLRKDFEDRKQSMKKDDGFYDDQIDKDRDYIFVFEHYNLEEGTVCLMTLDGDDFLLPPTPIPYDFGQPFVMLRNYDIPEKFYPMGELECLRPLQLELDFTRSYQLRDLANHVRKYVTRKGTLDDDNMGRLSSPVDGEVISIEESATEQPQMAVALMQSLDIPQQTYQMSGVIQDDMTRTSGVSDYEMGQMPETRRTATEAGIIKDASNARSADKLAQIENSLSKIARRVIQLGQQYITSDQMARMKNVNGNITWMPFNRDEIQGEFDFDVEAGSTQPNNESFRRQAALQLMDALSSPLFAPQPDPATGQITQVLDQRMVAEYVLRNGFGIPNATEFLAPPPPPPMVQPPPGMEGMPPVPQDAYDQAQGGMPPDQGPSGGEQAPPPPQEPPQGQ